MKNPAWRRVLAVVIAVVPAALFASSPTQGLLGPEPVSPGQPGEFRVTVDRCPTFSWSAVPGAWGYEIALYTTPDGAESVTDATPRFRAEIPAPATSWTPSLDQCLDPGGRYVWAIREKGSFGRPDGEWSRGFAFEIDAKAASPVDADLTVLLEELRRLQAQLDRFQQPGIIAPQGLAEDIENSVRHIHQVVDDILSFTGPVHTRVVQIHPNVLDIQSKTNDVKLATDQLRDIISENRDKIGPEVRALLDQAFDSAKFFATHEQQGMSNFLGAGANCSTPSPCFDFRRELLAFVDELQGVTNAFFDLGPSSGPAAAPRIDFTLLRSLLENVPGAILYPLYRVVEEADLLESLSSGDLAEDLRAIGPLFSSQASAPSVAPFGGLDSVAGNAASDSDPFERIYRLTQYGVRYKIIGTWVLLVGETASDFEIGIHGYPGLEWGNLVKAIGGFIDGAGETLLQVADFAEKRSEKAERESRDVVVAADVSDAKTDVSQVKTDVTALDARLTRHDESLSRGLADLDGDLTAVQTSVNNTSSAVTALGTAVDTGLVDVKAKVTGVGADVTKLGTSVEARFGGVENTLTTVGTTLNSVQTTINDAKNTVNSVGSSLQTDMAAVKGSVSGIGNDFASLSTRVGGFDSRMITIEAGVGETKSAVGTLGTTLGGVPASLSTLQSAVQETRTAVGSLTGFGQNLDSIQTTLTGLRSELSAYQTAFGNHDARLSAVGTALATHDQRLIAHEGAVSTAIAAVGNKADAVKQEVESLRSRLAAVEAAAGTIQSSGIERQLVARESLVSLYLPASQGGRLETVMELVSTSINRAAAAGVNTKDAAKHYSDAQRDASARNYTKAFDSLSRAYRALTSDGGGDD